MKILVTGASGFIGSAMIRRIFTPEAFGGRGNELAHHSVVALVRNTDQRNMKRLDTEWLRHAEVSGRLHIKYGDLNGDISGICENVDAVVNFAARTFVDHSIKDAGPFITANVLGTYNLLEDARRYAVKQFIQVSTDEVYGAILSGAYTEDARLNPTNPYSATKAGADCLVISYSHTYGMYTTVTRTENNYGPMQHKQKVLPVFVKAAVRDQLLPVYGDGKHSRMWLYVDDHVDALIHLLITDHPSGEVYHVAGEQELQNIELAKKILNLCGKSEDRLTFIDDHNIRPGHDRRYSLNCSKLRALGWTPKVGLDEGFRQTVNWYLSNPWWTE